MFLKIKSFDHNKVNCRGSSLVANIEHRGFLLCCYGKSCVGDQETPHDETNGNKCGPCWLRRCHNESNHIHTLTRTVTGCSLLEYEALSLHGHFTATALMCLLLLKSIFSVPASFEVNPYTKTCWIIDAVASSKIQHFTSTDSTAVCTSLLY